MPSFVEERKRRLTETARLVQKALDEKGKADYEEIVSEICFSTGVTDKKAREYLQLVKKKNKLRTQLEDTGKGRVYWLLPKA